MHRQRIVALDEVRRVAVSRQQLRQLVVVHPPKDGRISNLVTVEVEDRQHGSVTCRVEKLVGVPARRERAGLGLTITNDAGDEQARIVECRAVRVRQGVTELASFVDRAGRLRRYVTRDTARERELFE